MSHFALSEILGCSSSTGFFSEIFPPECYLKVGLRYGRPLLLLLV